MKLVLVQFSPAGKRVELLLLFVIHKGGLHSPIEQALLGAWKAPGKLCFLLTSTWFKGRTASPPTLVGFLRHFFLPKMMHLEFYPLYHAKEVQ